MAAVPPALSRLGILARFYYDMSQRRAARWTPPYAHENTVAVLERNVPLIAGSGLFDRFTVMSREGLDPLYDGTDPDMFVKVWSREFRRALSSEEADMAEDMLLRLIDLHDQITPSDTLAADVLLKVKHAVFGYPQSTPFGLPYLTSMEELRDWAGQ